jgi:tudor domain-containing protein 3
LNQLQHGHVQEMDQRLYQPSTLDRSYKGTQLNNYYMPNENLDFQGLTSLDTHKSNSYYNSNSKIIDKPLEGTWIWRIGDRCMAKYWEDNMVNYFDLSLK